jgi:hypothetical protein
MKITSQMASVMSARLITQQMAIDKTITTNSIPSQPDGSTITEHGPTIVIPNSESRAVQVNKMLFNNCWETYIDIIGP